MLAKAVSCSTKLIEVKSDCTKRILAEEYPYRFAKYELIIEIDNVKEIG